MRLTLPSGRLIGDLICEDGAGPGCEAGRRLAVDEKAPDLYLREALEGYRRVLGDDHQSTLISTSNLALVLVETR